MAILMTMDMPGGITEQYDRTNEILGIHGDANAPEGLISHVCGVTDDGVLIIDVWDSEESLHRFFEEGLGAALAEAGAPQADPTVVPVHGIIPQGAGTEANVIVITELPGFGTDAYDAIVANMDSHGGAGENHPCVSHVAGVTDDGLLIVDLWESPEAFAAFAQGELADAAPADMGPVEPRFVPVHNRIRGKAPAAA